MSGDTGGRERAEQTRDLLAADYVLGTLDAAAAQAVAQAAREDAGLAAAITAWEARLLPLADLAAPVEADLWPALAAAMDAPRERPAASGQAVVGRERLARPHQRAPGVLTRAWRSAPLWRAAAMLLLLASAALAARSIWTAPAPVQTSVGIATMARPGSEVPVAVAQLDRDGVVAVRLLTAAGAPSGVALGLWALPVGAAKPRLLGVLPSEGGRLRGPALPTGSTVMVTAEPATGPRPGAAPGPTLFAGIVASLP